MFYPGGYMYILHVHTVAVPLAVKLHPVSLMIATLASSKRCAYPLCEYVNDTCTCSMHECSNARMYSCQPMMDGDILRICKSTGQ